MLENLIKIGWNFLLLLPWHLTDLRRTRMGSLCCLINGFCFWEWLLKLCGNCCILYKMKKWGVLRSNKVEKMKCINWKTSFPFRRNLRPLGADADSFSKLIWQADIKQSKGEAECSNFGHASITEMDIYFFNLFHLRAIPVRGSRSEPWVECS